VLNQAIADAGPEPVDESEVTPESTGLWRAEVCRDGTCPVRRVACATSDGAMLSEDGTHCYTVSGTIRSWDEVQSMSCGTTRDAHPLTLHSVAERNRVAMLPEDLYWTGGETTPNFSWTSGEAWTVGFFETPKGPGDCVQFSSALNVTLTNLCALGYTAICETELWPTW